MNVTCPHCQAQFEFDSLAQMDCPHCQNIVLPPVADQAAKPNPDREMVSRAMQLGYGYSGVLNESNAEPVSELPAQRRPARPVGRNNVAGLLSFLIPGAGQIYRGQIPQGIFIFITFTAIFVAWLRRDVVHNPDVVLILFFLGFALWIANIYDATNGSSE